MLFLDFKFQFDTTLIKDEVNRTLTRITPARPIYFTNFYVPRTQTRSDQKMRSRYTRESRCLAGEPKHFPFAIVFVLIIKITLTCKRGFPNGNGS